MVKFIPRTWEDLPEFPDDEDLGAVVLGQDRKREFHRLATLREKDGMPRIDPFWGGRPKALVRRFIEADQEIVPVTPAPKRGVIGQWNAPKHAPAKIETEVPPKIKKKRLVPPTTPDEPQSGP